MSFLTDLSDVKATIFDENREYALDDLVWRQVVRFKCHSLNGMPRITLSRGGYRALIRSLQLAHSFFLAMTQLTTDISS